ncbi:Polysaccharide deacetylase [Desulfuromusa kysingii]|uniref:Polysaccharide deacetylase n=1 Tax=Desulfuromusa kysingii TaxID=37625 RepID=A0A1H4D588_9BACT|nr:polysaccharide deacetylase family protein [Desulfuromusa kysingii]SEA67874.1 Polysaccharide deacetylase [Desulfuromusa kysingii]
MKRLFLFSLTVLILVSSQSFAGQVNAFIYHRFGETRYPSTNISADIFSQQLDFLTQSKIEVITLGDVANHLIQKTALPEHAVSLSIDDAYRSFYDVGMPIIRRYGFPVTLFVNTDAVGTSGYLSWSELKELSVEGVEIGNHTASHAYLVDRQQGETFNQWQERIKSDIERAQQQFEKHLGFRPDLFAYPYGEYSSAVVEIIHSLGFKAAYAQQSGVIYSQHNRFILPRFPMGGPYATVAGFQSKLAMKPLQVTEEDPFDPVMQENPPVLSLQLPGGKVHPQQFNCFVQGENHCWVERDDSRGDNGYKVVADHPLAGRRNKFTLTLQNNQGEWLWYSHLWVNTQKKE